MESIKRFTWEIIPSSTPLYKKRCSKCKNSNYYYSSDKFRMNSQKRCIDVWLIYKCVNCDNTFNVEILPRTKPELINRELFSSFSMNDKDTAWKYAFDADIARKNNMEPDYSKIEYTILKDNISLQDMLYMEEEQIEFEIKSLYNFNLKLTTIIRECFNISLNQLEAMAEEEVIIISSQMPLRKIKVKDRQRIIVNRTKLEQYLN